MSLDFQFQKRGDFMLTLREKLKKFDEETVVGLRKKGYYEHFVSAKVKFLSNLLVPEAFDETDIMVCCNGEEI